MLAFQALVGDTRALLCINKDCAVPASDTAAIPASGPTPHSPANAQDNSAFFSFPFSLAILGKWWGSLIQENGKLERI